MRRKTKTGYGFWVLILAVIGLAVWIYPEPDNKKQAPERRAKRIGFAMETMKKNTGSLRSVVLFTAGKNGESLVKVKTGIDGSETVENQIKSTLNLLFSGEMAPAALFPDDMTIKKVFVYDGVAVLSLEGDFRRKLDGGVWTELLAVYSIVNTLSENFERIERVQILIDDREAEFFTSHVSIMKTIEPDFSYVDETGQESES